MIYDVVSPTVWTSYFESSLMCDPCDSLPRQSHIFCLIGPNSTVQSFCKRFLPHALLRQPLTPTECLSGQFKWVFCVRRILARRIKSSSFSHAHVLAQSQFTFVSPTSGMAAPVYFAQLYLVLQAQERLYSLADIGVCARARSKPGIMPTHANKSKITI